MIFPQNRLLHSTLMLEPTVCQVCWSGLPVAGTVWEIPHSDFGYVSCKHLIFPGRQQSDGLRENLRGHRKLLKKKKQHFNLPPNICIRHATACYWDQITGNIYSAEVTDGATFKWKIPQAWTACCIRQVTSLLYNSMKCKVKVCI